MFTGDQSARMDNSILADVEKQYQGKFPIIKNQFTILSASKASCKVLFDMNLEGLFFLCVSRLNVKKRIMPFFVFKRCSVSRASLSMSMKW